MWRLTLAQMRRNLGRLAAAGVAITLGAAFVAATLLASGVISATTVGSLTAEYADADLILTGDLTRASADTVALVPGITAALPLVEAYVQVTGPDGSASLPARAVAPVPELDAVALVAGAAPVGPGEIALTDADAERLGVGLGDPVAVKVDGWTESGSTTLAAPDLTVVGLLDADSLALFASGAVRAHPDVIEEWAVHQSGEADPWVYTVLATVDPGADLATVRDATDAAFTGDVSVRTQQEEAEARLAEITGETRVLTGLVLAFAAVALFVAALVIANTFQVIVAQRTRTLALLRCVGATKAQLRRSVLLEAGLLGAVSSAIGVVLGIVLVQVLLVVLANVDTGVPLPTTVPLTASVVIVPILVGLTVTVLAALTPARAATRVSPLAALQPVGASGLGDRGGRARAWISGLLMVGGAAGLVLGVIVSERVDVVPGLLIGILGGAGSFVGVLVGAVFWVPRIVGWIGALITRLAGGGGRGVAAKLATANAIRNPRRTAATSAALFIGVTLVAMMATGAATAREAFTATLDDTFPVDVEVRDWASAPGEPGMDNLVADLGAVAGVATTVPFALLPVESTSGPSLEVYVVEPDAAAAVVNSVRLIEDLEAGTMVLGSSVAAEQGVEAGGEITVGLGEWLPADVLARGSEVTFEVAVVPGGGYFAALTPADAARVTPDLATGGAWISIAGDATPRVVVEDLQSLVTGGSRESIAVTGLVVERAFFDEVVDTLLAVVLGLLAVSVVIALVGVSNTLSLSVLERRRESATLRAIGLTKARLRASLATEGVLVSVVGALVGSVLGTLYGWAGVLAMIGGMTEVPLTVAWRDLGIVLAIALAAGLVASVIPARAAVRTPPVVALAVE